MRIDRDSMAFEILKAIASRPDDRIYTESDLVSPTDWQHECDQNDIFYAYRLTDAFIRSTDDKVKRPDGTIGVIEPSELLGGD